MIQPSRNELTMLINLVYDAVEASKAAPIFSENDAGEKVINRLGETAFYTILGQLAPKGAMTATMTANLNTSDADAEYER